MSILHINSLTRSALAIISGLILSLPFLNYDYYLAAWIGFVPLLFAIHSQALFQSYLYGLLAGLASCASASYWVSDFIVLAQQYRGVPAFLLAFIFWLYSAQIFGLATLIVSWLQNRSKISLLVIFPCAVISVFSSYPMLFDYRLGDTQLKFKAVLQAIEYTGVYGIDLVILLFNVLVYQLILLFIRNTEEHQHKPNMEIKTRKQSFLPALIASAFITIWCLYGMFSYTNWQENLPNWRQVTVGVVQPNETPSLGAHHVKPGYSRAFPPEMALTETLVQQGAKLIVWSEAKSKGYFTDPHVQVAYQDRMTSLDADLLFQDIRTLPFSLVQTESSAPPSRFNEAILINGAGEPVDTYQKIKRMPIGEYVPLLSNWPLAKKGIETLIGEFLEEMTPGTEFKTFKNALLPIIPLICYETTFPNFVADAVKHHRASDAKPGVLIALSSNSWFGESHQPFQHVMASALRAVENRTPLLHVVNNGPSILALPNGDIVPFGRFQESGGYLLNIPFYDKTDMPMSFFSQFPHAFLLFINIVLMALIATSILKPYLRKYKN